MAARVLCFWFARGSRSEAVTASASSSAELALDRREIVPGGLARDLAILDLEDVQEPEAHRTALAVAQEDGAIDDLTLPQSLVDDEVLAVETADRRDALALHGLEE